MYTKGQSSIYATCLPYYTPLFPYSPFPSSPSSSSPLIVPSFLFLNIVLDVEIRGGAANWLEKKEEDTSVS